MGKNTGREGGVVGCSDGRHADFGKNPQVAGSDHIRTGDSLLCHLEFKTQKGVENARFAFAAGQRHDASSAGQDLFSIGPAQLSDLFLYSRLVFHLWFLS